MSTTNSPRRSKTSEVDSWRNANGELEIDVTQKAWMHFTGSSEDDLKAWVKDTILPDLPVFFEWRAATKHLQNQSPSRDEVKETMRREFALINREVDEFVSSGDLTNRQIWAHTVNRIKRHLATNDTCKDKFKDANAKNNASFDFLKFIIRSMSKKRCFGERKIVKGLEAQTKFTERKFS
jgi:hypothetical protein